MGITADDNLIQLMMTDQSGYNTDAYVYQMQQYDVTITLPPHSAIVLHALNGNGDPSFHEEETCADVEGFHTAWKEYV